jgi:hypothetical protein
LSDTAFIHEIRPDTPATRVQLTLSLAEVVSLGLMASAAISASVVAPDLVDEETARNANEMVRWTARASEAIVILTPSTDDKE